MTQTTTFTAAGTPVTFQPQALPQTYPMPSVDGGNPDLMVTTNGCSAVWIAFAPGATVGPAVPSNLRVDGNNSVLLTSNAATLAAAAANPNVMNTNNNGAFSTATMLTAMATQQGGSVTIQRGTATSKATF